MPLSEDQYKSLIVLQVGDDAAQAGSVDTGRARRGVLEAIDDLGRELFLGQRRLGAATLPAPPLLTAMTSGRCKKPCSWTLCGSNTRPAAYAAPPSLAALRCAPAEGSYEMTTRFSRMPVAPAEPARSVHAWNHSPAELATVLHGANALPAPACTYCMFSVPAVDGITMAL